MATSASLLWICVTDHQTELAALDRLTTASPASTERMPDMVVTDPTLLWIRVTDRQTEIVALRYPERGARNPRPSSRNRGSRRAVRAIRFIAAAVLALAMHPAFSEARAARALALSVPLPGAPIGDRPKRQVPATKSP